MTKGECWIAHHARGEVEKVVSVLDFTLGQPGVVGAEQVLEVVEFVAELGAFVATGGEAREAVGRDLVPLKFAEELAELAREAGESRGGTEDFQRVLLTGEQRAQHHHAAFVIKQVRHSAEGVEQPAREAVEGDDLQSRVTGELRVIEELSFELEGGLLGRKEQERRACGRAEQLGADFLEAAPGLAAAGGTEEEVDAHTAMVGREVQSSRFKVHRARGLAACGTGLFLLSLAAWPK